MENEILIHNIDDLKNKIYTIRGVQVMLDADLAVIYGYATKDFNRQVKNNIERFDEDFRFQLTDEEVKELSRWKFSTLNNDNLDNLRCKISTSSEAETNLSSKNSASSTKRGSNIKYNPYAFTEQGIYMLMTVLKGELAVAQSKTLIRLFKEMKHFIQNNAFLFDEIISVKQHLLQHDERIDELFTLMDKYNIEEKQGIFFRGQIFDAYAKFESFIVQAIKEIVLIDGYVDLSVLERLAKKKSGVNVTVYTDPKTKLTSQDIQKFNAQYPTLSVKHTTKMHDRFLIIDQKVLYHIGASLKDLGKKCFAFEILDSSLIPPILQNV